MFYCRVPDHPRDVAVEHTIVGAESCLIVSSSLAINKLSFFISAGFTGERHGPGGSVCITMVAPSEFQWYHPDSNIKSKVRETRYNNKSQLFFIINFFLKLPLNLYTVLVNRSLTI